MYSMLENDFHKRSERLLGKFKPNKNAGGSQKKMVNHPTPQRNRTICKIKIEDSVVSVLRKKI
jgi:hypothetical protein